MAFINYIFFDEQFKFVSGGFSQAGGQNQLKDHFLQNLTAQKSGYVYIYVSNTSAINVFFDNLQVVHTRSQILEETHYYPFGLTMAGISSKALAFGGAENKYKFGDKELQSKEFTDGSGLETYDFDARMYDPQIGRMLQIDPWVEKYERQSPYVGFNDNPIMFADPTGKGGELTVHQREDGTFYLKVTSKIYVYTNDKNIDAKKYASKIQSDIMSQWNNPEGKGYGQIGKDAVDVVFDVSVEAVTTERAEELAKDNKDISINFMALVDDASGGSTALGNSGRFDINQLNDYGNTNAAHEYGHLLGYHVPKGIPEMNSPGANEHDNNNHSWRSDPDEGGFIMSRVPGANQSQRRVHAIEYSRLGGGWERRAQNTSESEGSRVGYGGLYTPRRTKEPIPIVNPDKPLTNTIYK